MTRDEAYLSMLDACAQFQSHIAQILEVKAIEAHKAKNWICHHVFAESFQNHEGQLAYSTEIHDNIIEVIDGLAKMENSLAAQLKVILDPDRSAQDHSGPATDFFDFGGELDGSIAKRK